MIEAWFLVLTMCAGLVPPTVTAAGCSVTTIPRPYSWEKDCKADGDLATTQGFWTYRCVRHRTP